CNYLYSASTRMRYQRSGHLDCEERDVVITSGSLLSIGAYKTIGPFRNEFFIDYEDHEYCLRARAHRFKGLICLIPLMHHSLCPPTFYRIGTMYLRVTNHAAHRRYYFTRNCVVLMREYTFREPIWVVRQLLGQIYVALTVIAFETNKLEKLRAMTIGLAHGLRGRLGVRQPR